MGSGTPLELRIVLRLVHPYLGMVGHPGSGLGRGNSRHRSNN